MASRENPKQYLSLKALFESGSVKKMKDIEELFPTMIAKDLGMNHSRYISKLYKPELFSYGQIFKLALMLNVEPQVISNVINQELTTKMKTRKSKI